MVGQVASQLAERHRAGSPHGWVGPDTVLLGPGDRARLADPPPGRRPTAADAYDRDTRALGQLLAMAAGGLGRLPPAARELAQLTAAGGVVTPAAFVAQLDGLQPPPAPREAPQHHARNQRRQFADASLDELFGGPGAGD